MVHNKKTNVAIKGHVGEFTRAVVVDNTGDLSVNVPKQNTLAMDWSSFLSMMLYCWAVWEILLSAWELWGSIRPGMLGSGMEARTRMQGSFGVAEQAL